MQESQKRFNLLTWIKNYPIKFMIFILLIALPTLFIVLGGISFSRKNNRFYFDKNGDNINYLYQKNVNSKKDFDKYFATFNLDVEELKFINISSNEPTESYKFTFNKELNNEYKNASVSYRAVLATKYYDRQSSVLNNSSIRDTFTITYPFSSENNKNKLLFLKSGYPSLYLEVTIVTTIAGVGETKEEKLIYKLNINKAKIKNVIN